MVETMITDCEERIESLITTVTFAADTSSKLENLQQLKHELLLVVEDNTVSFAEFLPSLLKLLSDSLSPVRKCVTEVIGEVGLRHSEFLPEIIPALLTVVDDDTPAVARQAITSGTNIFCCSLEKIAIQVEQILLPLLFMRTVLQAIGAFPALVDFIMEILSRLVSKQIWKYPKLWVGFLKCEQLTQPHSFNVLLQLSQAQLEGALNKIPALKAPLAAHAVHQKSTLPRSVLTVLGIASDSQAGGQSQSSQPEAGDAVSSDKDVVTEKSKNHLMEAKISGKVLVTSETFSHTAQLNFPV